MITSSSGHDLVDEGFRWHPSLVAFLAGGFAANTVVRL